MDKAYKPCEYCGGTQVQFSNYSGVVCKGCGAKVTEIAGYYLGKPFTSDDLLHNPELLRGVADIFPYLTESST